MINRKHKADLLKRAEEVLARFIDRKHFQGEANRLRFIALEGIGVIFEEIEKSYGNCQNCYGKGYATVRKGIHGAWDFHPSEEFNEAPEVKVKFCECGRGQALKKLWGGKTAEGPV